MSLDIKRVRETAARIDRKMAKHAARIVDDWEPMDTAPKDGTVILVYRKIDADTIMNLVAWWSEKDRAWQYGKFDRLRSELSPTHWMPLPEPPQ